MTMDCYCDYNMPDVYSARIVKSARKEHVCEECRKAIRIGESYERNYDE